MNKILNENYSNVKIGEQNLSESTVKKLAKVLAEFYFTRQISNNNIVEFLNRKNYEFVEDFYGLLTIPKRVLYGKNYYFGKCYRSDDGCLKIKKRIKVLVNKLNEIENFELSKWGKIELLTYRLSTLVDNESIKERLNTILSKYDFHSKNLELLLLEEVVNAVRNNRENSIFNIFYKQYLNIQYG